MWCRYGWVIGREFLGVGVVWGMNDLVIYLILMKKKLIEEVIVFLLCEW